MLKQLASFLENIRSCNLLLPEQVEQIGSWVVSDDPDPQAIAREIVQRGWLTAFQVKMFWKGRGSELIFNQYVVLDRIGEGGMGEVYHARHRRMDRDVALKVIRRERLNSPDAIKRFGREIQAAARLSHENIVMAYDADQADGRHFFAMEFVEGSNLSRLVKDKGPLPILQACDCIRQAALGLQHAFDRGMLHRDIKPSNLLLNKQGVVKILDMGLALLLETPEGESGSRLTLEGLVVGTPDYLAPEQARNPRAADIRSDIYALGCTFYFLLCGHPPYQGGTPTEKLMRHSTEPIPPLTRPDVPRELSATVERMLAKNPQERFQTPVEVADALLPFIGGTATTSSGKTVRPFMPGYDLLGPESQDPFLSGITPPAGAKSDHEARTGASFRLPPPAARNEPPPRRSRRTVAIILSIGIVGLSLLVGGGYLLFMYLSGPGGSGLDKQFKNGFDMTFAFIPAGSFEMGSPDGEMGRSGDEGPVHQVQITQSFYISITEVTLRQYFAVLKRYPRAYGKEEPPNPDAPVANISAMDIAPFMEALNKDPHSRRSGWEYRLPTEAEWEYACRAGTKSRFNTGDSLGKNQAFIGVPTADGPSTVARYAPNAWGLHDMHGNVAEWVADYYDESYYARSPLEDPPGPEQKKSVFVVRGGCYLDAPDACRSARRKAMKEEVGAPDVGFRVVMAPINRQ